MNKNYTEDIVKKYTFRFSKNLGQNFLMDQSVLDDIVQASEISEEDSVIEIGPGVGTLTRELLQRAKCVSAIELDDNLIPILNNELGNFDNFNLIHADAMKFDFNKLTGGSKKVKIVANLPYYITTPIISKLLNENVMFDSFTVMVQKEVGERISSEPDCKKYGALSILVQYYCDIQVVRYVSASSFVPRPKVDSIVLKLIKRDSPKVELKDKKLFFKLVSLSFNMRRKTLWNALKPLGILKEDIERAFIEAGIDPRRRGETLSIFEFSKLSDCIYKVLQ